jgi:hypothetical protein
MKVYDDAAVPHAGPPPPKALVRGHFVGDTGLDPMTSTV